MKLGKEQRPPTAGTWVWPLSFYSLHPEGQCPAGSAQMLQSSPSGSWAAFGDLLVEGASMCEAAMNCQWLWGRVAEKRYS